jgi:hypothetical protein
MNITYSDFEATVKDNVGEVLLTSGGRALFRVDLWTEGVSGHKKVSGTVY